MKRLILALALSLFATCASAQCNGVFANNTVCGNATGASNTPRPTTPAAFPSFANGTRIVASNNATILTTDCGKSIQISGGFFSFTLPSPATFAEGCLVGVMNGDAWDGGRGKGLINFPIGFSQGQNVLWQGQAGFVKVVNGAWVINSRPGRAKVPPSTQFVAGFLRVLSDASLGTDIPGATDGLVAGTGAFAHLQTAMYMGCSEFDLNSLPQSIIQYYMAAGVEDTTGVHYACTHIPGGQGGAYVQVTGGTGATIRATNTDAFDVVTGSTVSIFGITCVASGTIPTTNRAPDCLRADYNATLFVAFNMNFGTTAGSHMAAENGGIILLQAGNYIVSGSAIRHMWATTGGSISTDYINVVQSATLNTNIVMGSAWASSGSGGTINVPNWVAILAGFTVTGTRARTTSAGQINTEAASTACNNTYFPGTVNGAVAAPFCS